MTSPHISSKDDTVDNDIGTLMALSIMKPNGNSRLMAMDGIVSPAS